MLDYINRNTKDFINSFCLKTNEILLSGKDLILKVAQLFGLIIIPFLLNA